MGITAVYVTHDQAEAMVISDRIAVMDSGTIVQIGTAPEIYSKPANKFVADFIGIMNFVPGKVVQTLQDLDKVQVSTAFSEAVLCAVEGAAEATPGKEIFVSIRPEDVEVCSEKPQDKENLFKGVIAHKAFLGSFLYFFVRVNGTMIQAQVSHSLPQGEGEEVFLFLDPKKCIILY